jgi:hypothetical protein
VSKRQDRRVKRRTLHALPAREDDPIARGVGVVTVSFDAAIPDETQCHYCKRQATTRDHIVPKGMRGSDVWWNLVPACEPCNRHKGSAAPTCRCAFCSRAVFLFELGHTRPEKSPRLFYIEPKPPRARKKRAFPSRTPTADAATRKYHRDLFNIKAPPLEEE